MTDLPPLKDSDLWLTPKWLLELVGQMGRILLDPCPGTPGWTGALREIRLDAGEDGLERDWMSAIQEMQRPRAPLDRELGDEYHGVVYVNPPYGRGHLDLWGPKIELEAMSLCSRGLEIVALLPATPGPVWFQQLAPHADVILFMRGRPRFVHPNPLRKPNAKDTQTGTKDTAVFYFGDRAKAFLRIFNERTEDLRGSGLVWRPER